MLDLHCHILPGIDDGATDLDMALQMARIAADDGIHTIACTPHIRTRWSTIPCARSPLPSCSHWCSRS